VTDQSAPGSGPATYPLELTADEMLALFPDCAKRAERLRQRGGSVVFVTGVELSLMDHGFLPGDSFHDRVGLLLDHPPNLGDLIGEAGARGRDFHATTVAVVRGAVRRPGHLRVHPTSRRDLELLARSAYVAGRDGERHLRIRRGSRHGRRRSAMLR